MAALWSPVTHHNFLACHRAQAETVLLCAARLDFLPPELWQLILSAALPLSLALCDFHADNDFHVVSRLENENMAASHPLAFGVQCDTDHIVALIELSGDAEKLAKLKIILDAVPTMWSEVFFKTKAKAEWVADQLQRRHQTSACAVHAGMSAAELEALRLDVHRGVHRVLCVADPVDFNVGIAKYQIDYELPSCHRCFHSRRDEATVPGIGRPASLSDRVAITFLSSAETVLLRALEAAQPGL